MTREAGVDPSADPPLTQGPPEVAKEAASRVADQEAERYSELFRRIATHLKFHRRWQRITMVAYIFSTITTLFCASGATFFAAWDRSQIAAILAALSTALKSSRLPGTKMLFVAGRDAFQGQDSKPHKNREARSRASLSRDQNA